MGTRLSTKNRLTDELPWAEWTNAQHSILHGLDRGTAAIRDGSVIAIH